MAVAGGRGCFPEPTPSIVSFLQLLKNSCNPAQFFSWSTQFTTLLLSLDKINPRQRGYGLGPVSPSRWVCSLLFVIATHAFVLMKWQLIWPGSYCMYWKHILFYLCLLFSNLKVFYRNPKCYIGLRSWAHLVCIYLSMVPFQKYSWFPCHYIIL